MDIVTQGLLGGVLAQAVANRQEKKIATLAGVAAGLLADADILISSSSDPLLNIEYHRHFSHSLLFIPFGAAIAMALLWPFLRQRLALRKLYLFCFAGYSMSGALDACTSYGTHLFWPLSDNRVALNIISIVDPLFSLALLTALLLGLRFTSSKMAIGGLLFCLAYLGFGYTQQQEARRLAETLLQKRGHVASQHVVKPTMANLVLWRSVYIHQARIYVDAIHLGWSGQHRLYPGESLPVFATEESLPGLDPDSVLYSDIRRFIDFSEGYVALDPDRPCVIGDIRYSMLPLSVKPLWGIHFDIKQPQQHVDYRFFRDTSKTTRTDFINLLLGRTDDLKPD
jgi:inner membrane protein